MPDFPIKLATKLEKRAQENALRKLQVSDNLVDFSSNDYLGFSKDEVVGITTKNLAKEFIVGSGSTGSRLLSGNHRIHEKLESFLASYHKADSALLFNSGYDANLGFFAAVPQRNDIVFYDELCHASIRDGIKLGNAKSYKFKHNDLEDLKNNIFRSLRGRSRSKDDEIYIVTESVFSMDGDSPDLKTLADFCGKNNLLLVVDEAHALGVFGKGLVNQLKLEESVFACIITFGKAMGCHGAAILGSEILKDYLVNFARSFIYTTAMAPISATHILAAYEHFEAVNEGRNSELQKNIGLFKKTIHELQLESMYLQSNSTIQSIVISGNSNAISLSKTLRKSGFDVRPIVSPTVPKGKERLRFCLHTFNTKDEIKEVLQIVKDNI